MKITNLKEMLTHIRQYSDRTAFKVKSGQNMVKEISYSEFVTQVNALGTYLSTLELSNKHVAIISENRYEWVVSYLAAVCGGVVVPIDRDLPEESLIYLLGEGDAEVVFYSDVYSEIISKANVKHKVCFGTIYHEVMERGMKLLQSGDVSFTDVVIDEQGMASLLFTSGTTGFSKGVMLSHKNIVSNIYGATAFEKYGEYETMLSILPYHHAFESTLGLMASLCFGATICINDSLKYLRDNMLLFKPTAMYVVPAIINAMYSRLVDAEVMFERPLTPEEVQALAFGGNLKKIFSGSAPLNVELINKFKGYGISLSQGYGLTETSPVVSTTNFAHINETNIKSVGEVIPGCEVKTVDNEIWVKGENVMLGYYKNPDATFEAMEGEWFKTGDLGYLDSHGFLFINGRKKNLIIASGGENVYPEEIEQYLYNINLIDDALVYGGDNTEKETVTAVIKPNYDIKDKTKREVLIDIRAKIDEINEILPVYKHITAIKFRDRGFEKTTGNKIKRNAENTVE